MYLVDANVWLALTLSDHGHHHRVGAWLDGIDEPDSVHFCRATQQALLRLLTNPAVLAPYGNRPLTNAEAWAVYEAFIADPRICITAAEPAGADNLWRRFAVRDTASPKLWMDAYLAAFALAGGYRMITSDAGFGQFSGLDLQLLAND